MKTYQIPELPKMKVIFNSIIPFPGFLAINLFGFIFVRKEYKEYFEAQSPDVMATLRHEYIHTLQQRELLYIFFYIWYITEWIVLGIISVFNRNVQPYRMISFEQEAYGNEYSVTYIKRRKKYAFLRYFGKIKNSENSF